MNTAHVHHSIQMTGNEVLRVDNGKGTRITCQTGLALITQEGDSRDITLKAGEFFDLDVAGIALVLSTNDACIKVGKTPAKVAAPVLAEAAKPAARPAAAHPAPRGNTAASPVVASLTMFAANLRNRLNLA